MCSLCAACAQLVCSLCAACVQVVCSLCVACVQLVCSLCVACVWHRMYVAMSMPCFGSGIAQVCRSIKVHACACVRACVCIVGLLWKSARWLGLGLKPSGLTPTK